MATRPLTASLEDYLEAIYHAVAAKRIARSKDIAQRLGVGTSSVTGALHALAERDLVNYTPYQPVTLTRRGRAAARSVVRRHTTLRDFFVKVLLIEPQHADEEACKMEHAMSKELLDRLVQFLEFVDTCPRTDTKFVDGFGYHCDVGCATEDCEHCLSETLDEVRARNDRTAETEGDTS